MNIEATIVFEKLWAAMHEKAYHDAERKMPVWETNEDGTLKLGEDGKPIHMNKWRYIVLEGSSRSSKTISLIDAIDLYAREGAYRRCTVWRNTAKDCKDIVLPDMQKRFKQTGRHEVGNTFNKTTSRYTYDNDSTFEIQGTEDENTVMGFGGTVTWFNEPYDISRVVFDQLDQRTTDFVIIDWNPKMSHWVEDIKKDPRCFFMRSTFKDNPFCPAEQRRKILSYQPVRRCAIVEEKLLSEADAKKYDLNETREGNIGLLATRTGIESDAEYNKYLDQLRINIPKITDKMLRELARCRENEFKNSANDYNWSVYGLGLKAEKPNRIFRWKQIADEVYFNLSVPTYTLVDWGAVDPWGIVDMKYYDGALYIHERNYASENEIRATVSATERAQIAALEDGDDNSIERTGIVKWLFRKLNIPYDRMIICDNNRISKILALREAGWEYAVAAVKPKGSVLDGIDLLNDIPVYYTQSSTNIHNEQENYSRKVVQGITLEEPEDTNNHTIDPTRYGAQYLEAEGILQRA